MKSELGFSLIETVLTLSILMLIFGTLLPISYQMMIKLSEEKQDVHVAVVSNQAAIERSKGVSKGSRVIDQVNYEWEWQIRTLCIQYLRRGAPYKSCKTF